MMPKCAGLEQVDNCEKDNMHFTLIPLQLALMQFMIQYQVPESPVLWCTLQLLDHNLMTIIVQFLEVNGSYTVW